MTDHTIEMADKLVDKAIMAYRKADYEKAKYYYEKATAMGNPKAACELGDIYSTGKAGLVDYEQAFYYFEVAALKDSANGVYRIGDAYFYGNFVKQNYQLAFGHYEKAAMLLETLEDEATSAIYYRLALCYHNGLGTEQNDLLALQMINLASTAMYYDRVNQRSKWRLLANKVKNLQRAIVYDLDEKIEEEF